MHTHFLPSNQAFNIFNLWFDLYLTVLTPVCGYADKKLRKPVTTTPQNNLMIWHPILTPYELSKERSVKLFMKMDIYFDEIPKIWSLAFVCGFNVLHGIGNIWTRNLALALGHWC